MDWMHTALTVLVLLLLALGLKPVAQRFQFPYPTLLVFVGWLASVVLVSLGIDTGLRWHNFHTLVYFVLLPILIYDMAFRLSADGLFRNLFVILLLAFPFMLVGVLTTAILLYLGIAHPTGFPFMAALIAAAIIYVNDPATIVRLFDKLAAPKRLVSLLKGESLFNSILALVLVSLALTIEISGEPGERKFSAMEGFILFVKLFSGGIFTGLLSGLIGLVLLHFLRTPLLRGIISLIVAYGTFLIAEGTFGVSGIVAVLTAGLLLNAYSHRTDHISKKVLDRQLHLSSSVASIALFLLLGVSVHLPFLFEQWIVVLLAIGALLIARAIVVFGGLWLHGLVADDKRIPMNERVPLFWGGIKGAVTIALVFSLPVTLPYSDTVQTAAYGVVLFSLFVQAPTLRFLLPR